MIKIDVTKHAQAILWHENFIKWAEENHVTNSDEYRVTKYALECIEFRAKYEGFINRNYKEERM